MKTILRVLVAIIMLPMAIAMVPLMFVFVVLPVRIITGIWVSPFNLED